MHNIFGERFLGRREPAWHGLGQTFDGPITMLEAVGRINAGYVVDKAPLFAKVGNRYVPVGGQIGLVRQPTDDDPEYRVLGVASRDDYGLVQNHELARILDPLSEQWPVETVGVLGQGETIFFTLDAGTVRIGRSNREEVRQFFLVSDTKNGRTAGRIAFTPVRVVCQNTLSLGLSAAVARASLRHSAEYADEMRFRVGLMKQMQRIMRETTATFNHMARVVLNPDKAAAIFELSYPYPSMPAKVALAEALTARDRNELGDEYSEQLLGVDKARETYDFYRGRTEVFRAGAAELFAKINDEHPAIANTPWAAYNAVVECEDYRNGGKGVLASALFGARAVTKARAFEAAYAAAVGG